MGRRKEGGPGRRAAHTVASGGWSRPMGGLGRVGPPALGPWEWGSGAARRGSDGGLAACTGGPCTHVSIYIYVYKNIYIDVYKNTYIYM